ncbi:MAG: flagellar biosynthetic protein FliR [Lachnospiraceae bacterium]|nr:flagellar biosynthetic protein FliR [Lachnospiraceae bacterium]
MSFTVENLEFFLMIVVRMSTFVYTAPFLSLSSVPHRVKLGISVTLSILMFQMIPYDPLEYTGTVGFAFLVIREAIIGLVLGFCANVCSYIVGLSGQLIDMEIGFSMVNELDPATKITNTITGNYYSYFVMLMLMITDMHYYIISAILDSFQTIPLGTVSFNPRLYEIIQKFMTDYFVIGFRIVLPVFASILLVNIVLGVLSKIAPQINMFVVGMQLKVFIGLFILFLIVGLIPKVSDFIFVEMRTMLNLMTQALAKGA